MKKYLIVFILLVFLSGCNNSILPDKNMHTCVKKRIKGVNSITNEEYTYDVMYGAKVDNGYLIRYSTVYEYEFKDKKTCLKECDIVVKEDKEINDKGYSGYTLKDECNCKKNKVTRITEFDISILEKYLKSEILFLKADNTFELEKWLEKNRKNDYDCK